MELLLVIRIKPVLVLLFGTLRVKLLPLQAHGNKTKNWCEFQSVLEGLSLCAALIVSVCYDCWRFFSWMRNIGKLLIPLSVKATMLRIFQMLDSCVWRASHISCEVNEVTDSFSNSY